MMNDPEYIVTDEMGDIVTAAKAALNATTIEFPVLNYQYGFIEELNETLAQYESDPSKFNKKFPLIWLAEPFTIVRGLPNLFGKTKPDIFIINATEKTWKAAERMENNYKPILFPIYRQLLVEIVKSLAFSHQSVESISHTLTKGYYWGEAQKAVLNDAVDCLKLGSVELPIHNNQNCTLLKSF